MISLRARMLYGSIRNAAYPSGSAEPYESRS